MRRKGHGQPLEPDPIPDAEPQIKGVFTVLVPVAVSTRNISVMRAEAL